MLYLIIFLFFLQKDEAQHALINNDMNLQSAMGKLSLCTSFRESELVISVEKNSV